MFKILLIIILAINVTYAVAKVKCGSNEVYSCGSICDNVCALLKMQDRKHCPIVNIKCNNMCYCMDGYARDYMGVCIPIKDCPTI